MFTLPFIFINGHNSVSYTHLDVYKRQTLNSDITKIDVMQLQRMISMENKIFEDMYRLMLYDNSQPCLLYTSRCV